MNRLSSAAEGREAGPAGRASKLPLLSWQAQLMADGTFTVPGVPQNEP